eukprot:CAMPEP_0197081196 /NCGR_PEP_ID=MMETSP1384-20130603/214514_1 /TAXON_ID=29189 /ORGANISM="Ammonia sp." /LENGTH=534 /DNA_ID=CAMNT_0042520091 /DNA_START=185 /DNA_END=1789 /DNA_ORIENTATION=+
MPSSSSSTSMNKTPRILIASQHTVIPVDRMISPHSNLTDTNTSKHTLGHHRHHHYELASSPSKMKNSSNSLIAHNSKHQTLHILLIMLLLFCMFLLISLCSPDMIGIDPTFQNAYYPTQHTDNFLFVYELLINPKCKLREHIKYTPKSQRKNPYILHDHFDPDIKSEKLLSQQHKKKDAHSQDSEDQEEDDEDERQEFPVRIHHLRRGFYFDTSFNDMHHEQIVKYKDTTQVELADADKQRHSLKEQRINHSYTALGVQFDEEYDVTVNGILLRIDEDALLRFDTDGAGKALRRESVPLQWIDFLYAKPREFTKNMQLEQDKLNTMKQQIGMEGEQEHNHTNLKHDIDDANSMINHVDIEVEQVHSGGDSESADDGKLEHAAEIELQDLVDSEQGVIVEDDKRLNKKESKELEEQPLNELDVMNEENTKKYQLNVWTYIVPKEIMIDDENGQFERIMKQSYVDVILSGCLDSGGQEFAKEFVKSTYGWTPFMVWNDDRGHSQQFKYEEQFITLYEYEKIDSLLNKYVFGNVKNA